MPFLARLKEIRGDKTQEAFADAAGISRNVYNQIERGKRGVGDRTAVRLADATGLPVDLFLPTDRHRSLEVEELREEVSELRVMVEQLWRLYGTGLPPTGDPTP